MDFFSIDPFAPASNEILERNLDALARTSPKAARAIRSAAPRHDVQLTTADDGAWTGTTGDGRRLASARAPLTEATRLADTVDIAEAAAVCVVGFGLGHHVGVLGGRMRKTGLLMCFEPDLGLLRTAFETIDHSPWMLATNFVLLTEPDDGAAITHAMSGMEGLVGLGVKMLEHPASRPRLGEAASVFGQRFTDVLKAIRTTLVTTLVQSETTLTNLLMNLDHYATTPGIDELRSCATGVPAVVVSAGPSLARNIALLAQPGVRDRVVIIAVQTVLRTLLDHGIRPHFVCALDHHEISKRFYEGLTSDAVEGVTLVVEPKANPVILDAFPGAIRCLGETMLDDLIGGEALRAPPRDTLKPGATVAHLCHYLARYMGCDPVILVGQDLGFTDGQYYAAGAAIHDVWAGELNEFTTLEMREWERIAREKSLLRERRDVMGRRVYTDEQMATYLAQFESDFASDVERGLRVIDATEGGVVKQHTTPMPLRDALDAFASGTPLALPPAPSPAKSAEMLAHLRARVNGVRADARRVNLLSRDTVRLLKKIRRTSDNTQQMNDLVRRVHRIRDEVMELQPAFRLTQFLNQSGTLNRARADRAIDLDEDAGVMDRQLQRAERDIRNVESIAEAAQRLCSLLEETGGVLSGGPKRTRDIVGERSASGVRLHRRRVAAVVHVDFEQGGLATTRDLEQPIVGALSPLRLTIARLLSARRLREVICLTDDEPRLRRALGDLADRVRYAPLDVDRFRARLGVIGPARRFAGTCWRGGVAQLTCFDELFEPEALLAAIEQHNLDAAVLVGPDWCAVDPLLIDSIVERFLEYPEAMRLTFTQAPPGLCGLLIDRSAATTLARNYQAAGPFATIGALLGYVPFAPQADPIARPMCVPVPASVRDLAARCIADLDATREQIARVLAEVDPVQACAATIAGALERAGAVPSMPMHVTLELTTASRGDGLWARWLEGALHDQGDATSADVEDVSALVQSMPPGSTLTLHGLGDPLAYAHLERVLDLARAGDVGVHVRTMLRDDRTNAALLDQCDVVSVDVLAASGRVYEALTGRDDYDAVRGRVEALLSQRNARCGQVGLAGPWIVPRITRSDETCDDIEGFYDGWLRACGCAVIDPTPSPVEGARIQPLPYPRSARCRAAREHLFVRCDGSVASNAGINVFAMGLGAAWAAVLAQRGLREQRPLTRAA